MPLFRVYIAMSLDGYIATPDGEVQWLEAYPTDEFDMAGFFKTIAVTVMGRKTFDQSVARNWPYDNERVIVLTHRPINDPPAGVEEYAGDVAPLAARLRQELSSEVGTERRDVWLIGGAESIHAFHCAGLVDRWEIFVAPVLLGDGIPLFPRHGGGLSQLRLTHAHRYDKSGFVEVHYEPQHRDRE